MGFQPSPTASASAMPIFSPTPVASAVASPSAIPSPSPTATVTASPTATPGETAQPSAVPILANIIPSPTPEPASTGQSPPIIKRIIAPTLSLISGSFGLNPYVIKKIPVTLTKILVIVALGFVAMGIFLI